LERAGKPRPNEIKDAHPRALRTMGPRDPTGQGEATSREGDKERVQEEINPSSPGPDSG